MHEPLKNTAYLRKKIIFNFLGAEFLPSKSEEILINLIFLKTLIQVIKKGLQIFTISDLREGQNDKCWKQAKSYNEFPIKQQFIMDWHYSVCTLWKCNIRQFYMTSNSAQHHILNHPTRGLNISLFQTNVPFLYPT